VETEDLAYAAAFLDGEGCFTVGRHWKITVVCENTYYPVVEWLHRQFGGSLTTHRPRKANHRPLMRWAVVARDAAKVCLALLPYLKEKVHQAIGLVLLSSTMGRGGGGTVSEAMVEERNRLAERIKALKCRL
jgi:hypothetical protein